MIKDLISGTLTTHQQEEGMQQFGLILRKNA